VHAYGMNMHAYMHSCGINRCACVHAWGDNSRALEAKLWVRKTYHFWGDFGVFMNCDG
jgi:hypothetical protein